VPTHTGKVQIVLVIWDRSRSAGSQNGWAKESAATEIYTVQMTRISAVIIITRPTTHNPDRRANAEHTRKVGWHVTVSWTLCAVTRRTMTIDRTILSCDLDDGAAIRATSVPRIGRMDIAAIVKLLRR